MSEIYPFLQGGGRMGELIRATDWSATSLGLPEYWPESLKSAVAISLNSGFPIAVYWGEDFTLIYNDAWSSIPGEKHPWALGKPGAEVWPEIWPGLIDEFQTVLNKRQSFRRPDAPLYMHRYGYTEECYFDYTLSPIVGADGTVGGVFNAVIETTYRVINERRNQLLHSLLNQAHAAREFNAAITNINALLSGSTADIPFYALYTTSELDGTLQLSAHAGLTAAQLAGVSDLVHQHTNYNIPLYVDNVSQHFPEPMYSTWPEPVTEALAVPITSGDAQLKGYMLMGVSARKRLDDDYRTFLSTVGFHTGTLLTNALAYEVNTAYRNEQALNEELAAANEELLSTNEELNRTQQHLDSLNIELHGRVTDRTKALAASEERLRLMVMTSHYPLMILEGEEFRVEIANQQLANFWGKTLNEILGRKLIDVLPELEGQPFPELLKRVYTTGQPYGQEEEIFYYDTPEGRTTKYISFYYDPLTNEEGEVNAIVVAANDITATVTARKLLEESYEQQQALNEEIAAANEELATTNEELITTNEELSETQEILKRTINSLSESENRFGFMLNTIPQQVWTAMPDGALNYVNQMVCDNFGYSGDEVVGHGWQKFIHPDDLPGCLRAWQASLQSGKQYQTEFRLLMHDGTYRWHLSRALPFIKNNEIKLWLGTNTDIELQKNNEQRKDEFLSIASHELRTPLTSIKAFNQLMRRTSDPEKLGNFLAKSSDHIYRLEKLINDLLDVTRINAGKMSYNMEPFNFAEMLTGSVEAVQHTAPQYELKVESNADITYTGDRIRLEQVVHNFLTNAVKYSPENKSILINSRVEEDSIIFSVQDFGIGIAPDHLDKIFDRYYRVDNTAMRFEGLGLGLFISSEILKRHHGTFWIESRQGEGSIFYFRLPLSDQNGKTATVVKTDQRYEDHLISIIYNPEQQQLEADWKGFQTFESVQFGCMMLLELINKNKVRKLYNDNRHVLGTWSEASEWVGQEWFPLAEEAGLQYVAWVLSPSAFSQLSAKKSVDVMQGNVVTQFFTDVADAMEWLQEK